MARLNKIAISLCALLFTSISFTPLAQASGHTHASASPKALPAKSGSERKKKATSQKTKTTAKTTSKKSSRTRLPTRTTAASQTALHRQAAGATKKCVLRKGYKKQCAKTVAACAVGRGMAVLLMYRQRYAREEGLGNLFIGKITLRQTLITMGIALALATVLLGVNGLRAALITLVLVWALGQALKRTLGGQTGDTLGAAIELGEVIFLLALL